MHLVRYWQLLLLLLRVYLIPDARNLELTGRCVSRAQKRIRRGGNRRETRITRVNRLPLLLEKVASSANDRDQARVNVVKSATAQSEILYKTFILVSAISLVIGGWRSITRKLMRAPPPGSRPATLLNTRVINPEDSLNVIFRS